MKIEKKEINKLVKNYYTTGIFSSQLYDFIHKSANEIASKSNFNGYSDIDEFINIAKYKLFLSLIERKFDLKRGDFYSFATTVIYNTYISEIKKQSTRNKLNYFENTTGICQLPLA
jgi:hypothetical protein